MLLQIKTLHLLSMCQTFTTKTASPISTEIYNMENDHWTWWIKNITTSLVVPMSQHLICTALKGKLQTNIQVFTSYHHFEDYRRSMTSLQNYPFSDRQTDMKPGKQILGRGDINSCNLHTYFYCHLRTCHHTGSLIKILRILLDGILSYVMVHVTTQRSTSQSF